MDRESAFRQTWRTAFWCWVVGIALTAVAAGIAANALRPTPLPWFAAAEYEIWDDCLETLGDAASIGAAELLAGRREFFLVDSRPADLSAEGSVPGAFSLPYDALYPVDAEAVSRIRSAAARITVVTFGDSTTAKLLADDLLAAGLPRVRYWGEGNWRLLLDGDSP